MVNGAVMQIAGRYNAFEQSFDARLHETTGPGDNFSPTYYTSNVGGSGDFRFDVKLDQRPFPSDLHNLEGTITLQAATSCKVYFPVKIRKLTVAYTEAKDNTWRGNASCVKNGPYTVSAWNGSAVTYTQPTLIVKEMNAGSSRTIDNNSLGTYITTHTFLPTPALGDDGIVFEDHFDYTDGALNGQGDWVDDGFSDPSVQVVDSQASFTNTSPISMNETITGGYNFTGSFDATFIVNYSTSADAGGFAQLLIGNATQSAGVILTFSAGDGASNEVSQVKVIDQANTNTQDGPFSFTMGVPHTVTLSCDGTDMTASIDGLLVVTLPAVDMSGSASALCIGGNLSNVSDDLTLDDLIVSVPPTVSSPSYSNEASDAAIIAYQTNATGNSPSTGMQIRQSTFIRLDDAAGLLTTRWGYMTSAEDITIGNTWSDAGAEKPFTDVVTEIVAASGNVATQRNQLWAAFRLNQFAHDFSLHPTTNPALRRAVYVYKNPGVLVSFRSSQYDAYAIVGPGTGNSVAYLNVLRNLDYGTGNRKIRFGPGIGAEYQQIDIVIRRMLLADKIPLQNPDVINNVTLPFFSTVNGTSNFSTDNSFLGFPIYSVLYQRIDGRTIIDTSTTNAYSIPMGYKMQFRSGGHVQGLNKSLFSGWQILNCTSNSEGWVPAADLGLTDIIPCSDSSFDAFIA